MINRFICWLKDICPKHKIKYEYWGHEERKVCVKCWEDDHVKV